MRTNVWAQGKQTWAEAKAARLAEEYSTAIELYTKTIKLIPKEPDPYVFRAICASRLGGDPVKLEEKMKTAFKEIERYRGKSIVRESHLDFLQSHLEAEYAEVALRLGNYKDFDSLARWAVNTSRRYSIEPEILAQVAWLRATCWDNNYRDAGEAHRLAKEACEKTTFHDATCLNALGCSPGEHGRLQISGDHAGKGHRIDPRIRCEGGHDQTP